VRVGRGVRPCKARVALAREAPRRLGEAIVRQETPRQDQERALALLRAETVALESL
jgi:hypothetical protein